MRYAPKVLLENIPDPTYPFLALNQLNRPQKLASGHGQSPINYELLVLKLLVLKDELIDIN